MKIYPEKLPEALLRTLPPIILISGDEILLVEEAINHIRQAIKRKGPFERKHYTVDSHFHWEQLLDFASNLSLFSEQTVIELQLPSGKINESGQKVLTTYLNNPPKNKFLICITPKLDANTQKTKWFKQIDNAGFFIPIWPLTLKQLPFWIRQRLQRYKMYATTEVIQLIADSIEGNLLAGKQEIEKLFLLYGQKQLTYDDVASVIFNNSRFDIFALTDAALDGNTSRTLKILNKLQEEGTEPTLILWSLTREIRTLIGIAVQIEKGQSIETVFSKKFIRDKQKTLISHCLKRHTSQSLIQILKAATEIDLMIKGSKIGNVWDAFQQISLKLSQDQL